MRIRKPLQFALGAVVLLCAGLAFLLWYEASHFRVKLSHQQISDMQIAFKGAIGQAIFSPQGNKLLPQSTANTSNGLNSVLASGPSAGQGLIDAYRKNPQEFKRYAQMLDTALNAERVGEAALNLAPSEIPSSSSQLRMGSHAKLDTWGDPFCLIPLDGKLAVVSGGPSKTPCNALTLSTEQLNKSERTMFAGPSGSVIVIVSKKQQERSQTRTPGG